jgi:hypothetical protein
VICPVQSLQQKYSASHLPPNQRHNSRRPVPVEGRWPSSRTWGGMRWTRQRRARGGVRRAGFGP